MNVVGRVGSLISQGVYSVATPFHPFGGAVDVIVVEQQDGTYRSTPWYVRFGKFQGVLKGAEKIVRISVNDVEADFHMFLDNSGEAYFVREVVSGEGSEKSGVLENPEISKVIREDINENSDDAIVNICENESGVAYAEEDQYPDQIEQVKADNERGLYEFQDGESLQRDSGSSGYEAYSYEIFEQVEDAVESRGSDSEVVLMSVDGHVLTAPISSSSEENTENLQLNTPQFHLGPGEGPDFNGEGNEEFNTGEDAWAADYLSGIDSSAPNYNNASGYPSPLEVCEVPIEVCDQTQDSHNIENMENVFGMHCNTDDFNRKEASESCLKVSGSTLHIGGVDSQEKFPPCMEMELKEGTDELQENFPSRPATEETEERSESDFDFNNGAEIPLHNSVSPCERISPVLSVEIEASNKNSVISENVDCMGSDSNSVRSMKNDPGNKDEQFGFPPEDHGLKSSPEGLTSKEECDISEIMDPQTAISAAGTRSSAGMGFEISLCGNLLRAGMGLGPAGEAFDAHRISEEEFKASAASIIKNINLIVRFKDRYLPWDKAAPIVLGMAAFGFDLPVEPKDTIPVEDTPAINSSPSGRRWRLWPIPFRRVKTLQRTSSNASSEEVFLDTESVLQTPEATLASNPVNELPHMQLLRTNIPTTEQIASLNLKEGQNMVAFSFSTRVLGNQQVDAHIYLWKWNARIVISDVDGTITKSDVLGQFMPLVGKDWTQSGVARFFSAIKENGYQLLFLSARAIVQAYLTRSFLLNLKQDGKNLPNGPVVISPDGLFPSLFREVIRRAPHEFKIACLEDIRALFPSDYNPFYAGFGNRDTDELSYRKIGIPRGKIFIINPKGEVAINNCTDVKSYTSLHTLVNDMFPPTSLVEQEDYNSWNFWRVPLPNID